MVILPTSKVKWVYKNFGMMSEISCENLEPQTQTPPFKKETICSSCGLCSVRLWPAKESIESCVFNNSWLGENEVKVFGRMRNEKNFEESRFGITKDRYIAQLNPSIPDAQWSGIITRISQEAMRTGMIEAVMHVRHNPNDNLVPVAYLSETIEEIPEAKGNKPTLAPTLRNLEMAAKKGLKDILVVGASCHVHILRDFQDRYDYLKDMNFYFLGIPCTDNVKPKNLRWILEKITPNHKEVVHYEFMQDFQVHFKHKSGKVEKIPYFCIPQELSRIGVFAYSCMSCFDYLNSLSDLTVGYLGAPLENNQKWQWLLVRTEKGRQLLDLIKEELVFSKEFRSGDAKEAVKMNSLRSIEQMKAELNGVELGTGSRMPMWGGKLLTLLMKFKGPKGLEFARYSIDFHLIRNYYFLKLFYPEKLSIVPPHVLEILNEYDIET